MKALIKLLKSRFFWINILLAIIFVVLGWKITFWALHSYTSKREVVTVPDIRGLTMEQAQPLLEKKNLEWVIQDSSLYNPNVMPGSVRSQLPKPGQKVKEYRKIYLSVFKEVPNEVVMPNLVNLSTSLTDAQLMLQNLKLELGEITYGDYIRQGIVIGQLYRGDTIKAGESIPQGAVIDLVVGDGYGEKDVRVPDLMGLPLEELKTFVLPANQIMLGMVIVDSTVEDTLQAFVYRQEPAYDTSEVKMMRVGEAIDVWITNDSGRLPVPDTLSTDTIPYDETFRWDDTTDFSERYNDNM